MKKLLFLLVLNFASVISHAQFEKPIAWSYKAVKSNKTEATLYIKAKLQGNWHVYAQNIESDAMKLKFTFSQSKDFTLVGKLSAPKPKKKYDKTLKMNLYYFEKEAVFTQKINLKKSSTIVKGKVEFMVCNDKNCLPADEISFSIPVK